MGEEILILYHSEAAKPVSQAHKGEWFDLRAAKDYDIKAGDFTLIDLGVSIKVAPWQECIVAPRSSTFKNTGLIQTNSIGVIDNAYCGDNDIWFWATYATRDVQIKAGDRLAQFRVVERQPDYLKIREVKTLGSENRGGHGSTGTR